MRPTIQELQTKLELLREQYKKSTGTDKKMLEIRGKLLKKSIEKRGQLI